MKCPRCGSENTRVEPKEYKPKLTAPIVIVLTGFGLMFLGIVGAIVGALLGLLVGAIVNGLLPQSYQGVIVCQNCGCSSVASQVVPGQMDDGNVIVAREKSKTGNAVMLEMRVDNGECKYIAAGGFATYNLENGEHSIFYRQTHGIGKNERTGVYKFSVCDGEKKTITIKFAKMGLDISECLAPISRS